MVVVGGIVEERWCRWKGYKLLPYDAGSVEIGRWRCLVPEIDFLSTSTSSKPHIQLRSLRLIKSTMLFKHSMLPTRIGGTRQVRFLYTRCYSSTAPREARNRLYNSYGTRTIDWLLGIKTDCSSVRNEEEFENLNLLSASSRVPLITLWGASWCPSCKVITPLIKELIQNGVGEAQGGVSFAEVELDSPTLGPLAMRYSVKNPPDGEHSTCLTLPRSIHCLPCLLLIDKKRNWRPE